MKLIKKKWNMENGVFLFSRKENMIDSYINKIKENVVKDFFLFYFI